MITLPPGLHDGIAEHWYHSDPCPVPSLSSSVAKLLVERSPLHAWTAHPKLNPDWEPSESTKQQDIGTAAHALLLGAGRDIAEIPFENYRKHAAQKARDLARAKNFVPVLSDDVKAVRAMVAAAHRQLAAHEIGDVFAGDGRSEVTLIWREGPTWCRGRIDRLPAGWLDRPRALIVDYKTTSGSAEPDAATSWLYGLDADIQAGFYERGIRIEKPKLREIEFAFVVQEAKEPFALSVIVLGNKALDQARENVAEAMAVWDTCMKTGRWPGYPPRTCYVDPPGWTSKIHEERKVLGTTPTKLLKLAMDFQAPHGRAA